MTEQETDVSWALKILEREHDYEPNILAKYSSEIFLGLFGAGLPVAANMIYKRPYLSGIQRHILCASVGVLIGKFIKHREEESNATRDAQLRDYIMRHPEDFPPPERKKWGEVLTYWVPMR